MKVCSGFSVETRGERQMKRKGDEMVARGGDGGILT